MSLEDTLLARFGGRERTWRIRALLRKARFLVSRRLFGASYAWEEASARFTALPYLLRNAVLPIVLALVLVAGMDLLDGRLTDIARDLGWRRLNPGTYDVLLEAVAAVTGVFLALYFTAVSTVAASVYVNVPHDIRALIVRDRLGNVYVIGVAFTMALSITVLIAHALTDRVYQAAPVVVGLLAAFSIFAFIRLGQRAFYLADPTLLANTLAYDFFSWFKRARQGGWRWDDPSFQEHYRQQARKSTTSLASLLAIASDQPHLRGSSVRQLTVAIVGVLTRYLRFRDQVPTKSRWFGQRYEHKQWYLTDSTELDTATETGTGLTPQSVPDVAWVEDELLVALAELVSSDLKEQDYEDVYVVIGALEAVWTQLGATWSAKEGSRWTTKITEQVLAGVSVADTSHVTRPALVPAVWDALAMLPIALELGFHRNVRTRSIPELAAELESTDWSQRTSPYGAGVPRPVISVLEDAHAGRAFEATVKASPSTRTPNWYVREIALHAYERAFQEQVEALVELITKWYPSVATRLSEAGLHDPAGAVLSRGFEVAWKLSGHIEDWEQMASDLRKGPLLVDLVRPVWDWERLRSRVKEFRVELLRQLAATIPAQALRVRDEDVPDFLGHAVHRVGEACFESLSENRDDLFAQLFPTYFVGVLTVVERIQPQVQNWQPGPAVTAIAEPVVDALDLSGYAIIFSELHRNPRLWEPCETTWHKYFKEPGGTDRLKAVAAMHAHQQGLFAITHRSIGRTRWQMAANRILAQLPREQPTHPLGDGEVRHESPLIRRIAPDDDLMGSVFQASDIFVVRFLQALDGGADLDYGLADWVGRELRDLDNGNEEERGHGD